MARQSSNHRRRAVFLDRDGTINEDTGYLSNPNDLQLIPGSAEAIRTLNHRGWLAIVISNQSGIGRGFFTEEELRAVHQRLVAELAQHGARLDAIYYCPHTPDDQCQCRKPQAGLLEQAAQHLQVDCTHSWMVGDHDTDVLAGASMGCRTALVLTGHGQNQSLDRFPPDLVAPNLASVVAHILRADDTP